jgi:hypothetical protein
MRTSRKIEEELRDYLSLHIKIDKEYRIAWILHLHLSNNLKAEFVEEAMTMQGHGTPETPRFKIVRLGFGCL